VTTVSSGRGKGATRKVAPQPAFTFYRWQMAPEKVIIQTPWRHPYEQAAGVARHTVSTRGTILLLVKGAAPCCFTEVSV
jgi:hypothetical protein